MQGSATQAMSSGMIALGTQQAISLLMHSLDISLGAGWREIINDKQGIFCSKGYSFQCLTKMPEDFEHPFLRRNAVAPEQPTPFLQTPVRPAK